MISAHMKHIRCNGPNNYVHFRRRTAFLMQWPILFLSAEDTYESVIGDDWEHEEIFTDDDETVGNDPEEREDLAPEVPAPPEIKQVSFHRKL